MLLDLITSGTRQKLLFKFFLFENSNGFLNQLTSELKISLNGLRVQLDSLEGLKILTSKKDYLGRIIYTPDKSYPFYEEMRYIVKSYAGLTHLDQAIQKFGEGITEVSLGGLWAQAIDDGIAEIWVAGHLIEKENFGQYLNAHLVTKGKQVRVHFVDDTTDPDYLMAKKNGRTYFTTLESKEDWDIIA